MKRQVHERAQRRRAKTSARFAKSVGFSVATVQNVLKGAAKADAAEWAPLSNDREKGASL
jgi:hypothetical protein